MWIPYLSKMQITWDYRNLSIKKAVLGRSNPCSISLILCIKQIIVLEWSQRKKDCKLIKDFTELGIQDFKIAMRDLIIYSWRQVIC